MTATVSVTFTKRPPLIYFYIKGLFTRRAGLSQENQLPSMKTELKGFNVNQSHLNKYLTACSLLPANEIPLLYPQMIIFPLHMGLISHQKFPLPYMQMLQLRNHVIRHRRIETDESLDVACEISCSRIMKKGLEIDMYSTLEKDSEIVWENINTYFFPGKFGQEDPLSRLMKSEPLSSYSSEPHTIEWTTKKKGGWRFSRISGDYNGIHYSAFYARMLGFKKDFLHGQATVVDCVKRLPELPIERPVRFDVALKGPVYYKSDVALKYISDENGYRFDLYVEDNPRPCIVGEFQSVDKGSSLLSPIDA